MQDTSETWHKNLDEVRARIAQACVRAGRNPAEVTLIGASKTVPAERVQLFHRAGLNDFGENYVQEAAPKITELASLDALRWHFIGALQRNKAREAVRLFALIQSVDRASLAVEIDKAARAEGKVQEILLQVNVGDEASKAGCTLRELPSLIQTCLTLSQVRVRGLMCLPPFHENATEMRPYFRALKSARAVLAEMLERDSERVLQESTLVPPLHLSMGMTNDFEVAIEEGATMVRIGTALFGARAAKA